MNTPLKETTVYVETPVKDAVPEIDTNKTTATYYFTDLGVMWYNKNKLWYYPGKSVASDQPTHWLKPQQLFTFTREELEKILYNVFAAGEKRQYEYDTNQHLGNPAMYEYIQSLLPPTTLPIRDPQEVIIFEQDLKDRPEVTE